MEGWPSPVDGNSLENCQGGNLLASSNLAPSANTKQSALWRLFCSRWESKAPARFTSRFERRKHVALRQLSQGRKHLVESKRSA
jgi:hypothetical protein